MSKHNKSYRIRTSVGADNHYINFNMNQSYNKFEILSLEINQDNVYRLMQSNTGIIVGRVVANGGFGIPNAKLSIFVEYDGSETYINDVLYRYTSPSSIGNDSVRYNLISNDSGDDCYQDVGTFPTKRYLLDNNDEIEVFEKYYKYTTRTNNSGDYMIYGVPTGNNVLHCDIDLSDIGVLSQTPRDMMYHGYNKNLFESASKFKKDKNLSSLSQIITQDKSLYVYPFWGDTTESSFNAAITRCDIQISYKFESTCVFLGSVITDTGSNGIGKKCKPTKGSGKMSDMITGTGRIEMIRKTQNGSIEQFSVQGNKLIDESGTWCYQIPMNLDYVVTDEYGNTVLSDNPEKGIATRSRVRFRISMTENPADGVARKRARYLIPNNPRLVEEDYPSFSKTKNIDYEFGSKTKDENFRDLMWNNVYTIKNYIPRLQKSRLPNNLQHLGIKKVNHPGDNNPMPYNKLSIKFNFMYTFICVLIKVLVSLTRALNIVINFFQHVMLLIAKMCCIISNWETWSEGWTFLAGINGNTPDQYGGIYDNRGTAGNDGAAENWVGLCLRQLCKIKDKAEKYKWGVSDMCSNTSNPNVSGIGATLCAIVVKMGPGIKLSGLCEDEDGNSIDIVPVNRDGDFWTFLKEQNVSCFIDENSDVSSLYNCVENQLAQENEVTSFNFYNDWVNGVLYLPLWFRKIKPKKTFLGIQINPHRERWCNGLEHVKNRDLKVYNNCVIKRNIIGDTLQPLDDDYETVDVNQSKADDDSGVEKLKFKAENDSNCFGFKCHKYGRTETPLPTGLIIEKETIYGEKVYYYKPSFFSNSENDMVTLFATDIVLLGSLNKCDIHGIPQFFKILESTTYQMPPDLLSEEYKYKSIANTNSSLNTDENERNLIDEGSRYTEYTGADWGDLGSDQSNYKNGKYEANENIYDNGGLFYGLTCWDSYTKPKSIINLERICEVGVSLDESQELLKDKMILDNNNIIDDESLYSRLTPDGYISYDEIYNPDYRSMFATMNGNFLKTKLNFETGLTEYDLTHVYLDNFDGSLQKIMKGGATQGYLVKNDTQTNEKANYRNNYKLEVSDTNYINFRYGNYKKNNNKKIFYYQYDKNMTVLNNNMVISSKNKFPRYENSFYFYFGLKNGYTAIDRFYREYYSDCTPNQDFGKSFEYNFVANEWCSNEGGYIEFKHELDLPISLKLIDKDNETNVYSADNINYNNFRVGNQENYNGNHVELCLNNENVNVIRTGSYYIEIIDSNGDTYYDEIEFHKDYLTYEINTEHFNLSNNQLMDKYPCTSDNYTYTILTSDGIKYLTPKNIIEFGNDNERNGGGIGSIETRQYTVYCYKTMDGEVVYKRGYENLRIDEYNNTYRYYVDKVVDDTRTTILTKQYDCVYFYDVDDNLVVEQYPYENNGVYTVKTHFNNIDDYTYDSDTFTQTNIPSLAYFNEIAISGFNENEDGWDRNDGGYIMISNISVPKFRIRIEGGVNTSYWYSDCIVIVGDNNTISVDSNRITGSGYIGVKDGVFYFGVPLGNETYTVTVTEICVVNDEGDIIESANINRQNVVVYEGTMKLYINGIDYDIIKNFKTGWDKTSMNTTTCSFNSKDIKGWNDITNIGVSIDTIEPIIILKNSVNFNSDNFDSNEWDEFNGVTTDIEFNEYNPYSDYVVGEYITYNGSYYVANQDIIAIDRWECTNVNEIKTTGLSLKELKNEVGVSPYIWNGVYVIDMNVWNSLSDDFYFISDMEGREPGDEGYVPTFNGNVYDKCALINDVIVNRKDFTRQMMGTFRLTTKGYLEIILTVETKSKPVQYLIVNNMYYNKISN